MLASGALIAASLATARYPPVGRLSSILMAAAAATAGLGIAARAWRSLRARSIGIELLVTIAATGAIVLGETGKPRR